MQLIARRTVLGVEHRDERASGERKRGIQGFRLGARTKVRRNQDLEGRTGIQLPQSLAGRGIIGLQHENDLQFLRRIVELAERREEARHGARLVIERDHYGVDRQVVRSQAQCPPASPPGQRADDAQRRPCEEDQRERGTCERPGEIERHDRDAGRGGDAAEPGRADARRAACRRKFGPFLPQGFRCALAQRRCTVFQRKAPQTLRRGEPEAVLRQGMCAGDQMARAENLRRHDIDKRVRDAQRQQAGFCRLEQPVIRERAGGARHVEPLEWHLQPSGERPHVIVLGKMPRCDQDLIGTDVERKRPLLGGGKQAGWHAPAQAIEFRTARACPALRKRDPARFGHIGPDRSAPAPLRRPFELDGTQTAAPPRLFVYKQAAGGALNTTDDHPP